MAEHLWTSSRLVYRGLEPKDEDFIFEMYQEPGGYLGVFSHAPSPMKKQNATDFRTQMLDKCLVAAVICLPASAKKNDDGTKANPVPIGHISLSPVDPTMAHHRHCDIAVGISPEYRDKGYGTEAIQWILEWGFQRVNLHSIGLGTSSWNERALHVYDKIGFKVEGRRREHRWFNGKYYDYIELGMLKGEWIEKYLRS